MPAPSAEPPAPTGIRVRDLEFAYPGGGFRLRVGRFDAAPGERCALVGRSGTGKSTLLDLLSGIRRPDRGSVRLGDCELSALDEARRRAFRLERVGFVFQEFSLLDHLTVRENVLLPYLMSPTLGPLAAADGRARALAEAMGVGALLRRKPRELSQGERQRVALCRALVTEPAYLLADEPTGNLDPHNARRAVELLTRAADERGATLVLVTHDRALLGSFDRTVDVEELTP